MPKFSIIVPVYNVEDYLDECVQSVVEQTYADWELILVDDGSPDNCPKMCDNYSKSNERIRVVHKKNGGLSDARNAGLDAAIGEYGIFMDSDDYWNQNNALELLNERIIENQSEIIMFGCTDYNMSTGESFVSRSGYDYSVIDKNDKDETLHYLLSTKKLPGGSTIFAFKLDLINRQSIRFKVGVQDEDYDFVLSTFLFAKSISAIDDPFYQYRIGRDGSITSTANIKMIYGIDYTLDKWIPLCEKIENQTIKKDILNYLAFIYSTSIILCGKIKKEDKKEAISILKKYKYVFKYSYWRQTNLVGIFTCVFGYKISTWFIYNVYRIVRNK